MFRFFRGDRHIFYALWREIWKKTKGLMLYLPISCSSSSFEFLYNFFSFKEAGRKRKRMQEKNYKKFLMKNPPKFFSLLSILWFRVEETKTTPLKNNRILWKWTQIFLKLAIPAAIGVIRKNKFLLSHLIVEQFPNSVHTLFFYAKQQKLISMKMEKGSISIPQQKKYINGCCVLYYIA